MSLKKTQLDLSILLVNYNGLKFLKDCIESIHLKTDGLSYEIIILDNDSKDGSVDFIKINYPEIKLIASATNYGFGKGNNEAFKMASGSHILLLNNDTILLDQLLPIVNYLKADTTIGAVGINMLNANREILAASGDFPTIRNMFYMKKIQNNNTQASRSLTEAYDVDWITGSFMLMPHKVYAEINGFDEDYFLYVEDVDLCRKIADRNYRRVFMPHYNYIHFVGFSTAKNPLLVRGYEIYIGKHFSGFYKVLISFALSINKVVKQIKQVAKP